MLEKEKVKKICQLHPVEICPEASSSLLLLKPAAVFVWGNPRLQPDDIVLVHRVPTNRTCAGLVFQASWSCKGGKQCSPCSDTMICQHLQLPQVHDTIWASDLPQGDLLAAQVAMNAFGNFHVLSFMQDPNEEQLPGTANMNHT